jgi:hypothetical protein
LRHSPDPSPALPAVGLEAPRKRDRGAAPRAPTPATSPHSPWLFPASERSQLTIHTNHTVNEVDVRPGQPGKLRDSQARKGHDDDSVAIGRSCGLCQPLDLGWPQNPSVEGIYAASVASAAAHREESPSPPRWHRAGRPQAGIHSDARRPRRGATYQAGLAHRPKPGTYVLRPIVPRATRATRHRENEREVKKLIAELARQTKNRLVPVYSTGTSADTGDDTGAESGQS